MRTDLAVSNLSNVKRFDLVILVFIQNTKNNIIAACIHLEKLGIHHVIFFGVFLAKDFGCQ